VNSYANLKKSNFTASSATNSTAASSSNDYSRYQTTSKKSEFYRSGYEQETVHSKEYKELIKGKSLLYAV
jgi:hypothetical protein